MIIRCLVFAAVGLIGVGYFICDGQIAGQISCGIMAVFGISTAIAWNELDKWDAKK